MTIKFSSISFDLQIVIAKKIDFRTNLQLQLSSKEGRSVGESTSQFTVLDVNEVQCHQDVIRFMFEDPITEKKFNKRWSCIREYSQLPMFCIHYLKKFSHVSHEAFDKFLEEAKFAKKNAKLSWSPEKLVEIDLFVKVVEKLNVTSFSPTHTKNTESNHRLATLPQLMQMESISFPINPVPDALFLAMKAPEVSRFKLESHPDISYTVNRFLKQWNLKHREISRVWITTDENIQTEDLFCDLPVSMMFSNRNTAWGTQRFREIYLLDRGDKQLQLILYESLLILVEIQDLTLLKKEVDLLVSREESELKRIKDMQKIKPRLYIPEIYDRRENRLTRTLNHCRDHCTVS